MWEAGQMKDASARRLEGANALHGIEEELVEINRSVTIQQIVA